MTLPGAVPGNWRKASRSQGGGNNCVETRTYIGGPVEVRDSKVPQSGNLTMSRTDFAALLNSAQL